jgi:hypothetical protein
MTNDNLDLHRPTAVYRDYLEGEVIYEFRRRRTFRRLRAAAVIIVSVGIGMSATLASAQVRGDARRDSLMDVSKSEAMFAAMRLLLAQAQLKDQQKQVSAGARPTSSLMDSELQLRLAEEEVARVILNAREIEASGLPPRDELNAPLVKGEDFVKQRIENRMMSANKKLQAAEQNQSEISRRVAVGALSDLELSDADVALLRARGDLAVLAARSEARTEFLSKHTSVDELMRRVERTEVQQAVIVAQRGLATAQKRLTLVEQRMQAGAASETDVLRARLDVGERQIDLQKAALRLKQIK